MEERARQTSYERDADDNPTRLQRPNGSVPERQYDAQGNVLVRTERFNGATYRYTYDQYSLVTSRINPRGHRMQMDRDARGNMGAIGLQVSSYIVS